MVACKMEAQLECICAYIAYTALLHVWHQLVGSVGASLAKFLHRSSVRNLLRVGCWLGSALRRFHETGPRRDVSMGFPILVVCNKSPLRTAASSDFILTFSAYERALHSFDDVFLNQSFQLSEGKFRFSLVDSPM